MRRKLLHYSILCATAACALLAIAILSWMIYAIGRRGWPAISWRFFSEQIRLVGAEGGIFYNLVGSCILLGTALVLSTPVSTALALLHGVYLRQGRGKRL